VVSWLSYSSFIPPNLFILVAAIGVVLAWRTKWFGLAVTTVAIGCLYLVSLPIVAHLLIRSTEAISVAIPMARAHAPPPAIIVFATDLRPGVAPGEADTIGPLTLERLAEAAGQQRHLGLSILVSGGPPRDGANPLAALMSEALRQDFGVTAQWREDRSRNTF